jgi:hypothetical protein
MEDAVSLVHVPEPAPDGCTGACFGHPEADDWRASDPNRYCDWVVQQDEALARAPVSSAWALTDGVVWATGLDFDQACALVRRALLCLSGPMCTAEEAVLARADIQRAGRLAEASGNEVFTCADPLCQLGSLASLANACAHVKLLAHVDAKFHAGLWRSVSIILERAPVEDPTEVHEAISALRLHAQCEALRLSASACFEAGQAAAARACSKKALDVARVGHVKAHVRGSRVRALEHEFDTFDNVCERLKCGTRVFDTSLLCPAVPLPDL